MDLQEPTIEIANLSRPGPRGPCKVCKLPLDPTAYVSFLPCDHAEVHPECLTEQLTYSTDLPAMWCPTCGMTAKKILFRKTRGEKKKDQELQIDLRDRKNWSVKDDTLPRTESKEGLRTVNWDNYGYRWMEKVEKEMEEWGTEKEAKFRAAVKKLEGRLQKKAGKEKNEK